MAEVLRLTGIETSGRHGASTGEQDSPQPFLVDLEVVVEPTEDELASTADYRELAAATREVVSGESHVLLETIARRVAEAVGSLPGVVGCRAVVHKPAAASRHGLEDVSAEADSRRDR
ncbi:MAG TPA: dihydroneopterin aldolase [Actinomycetota bacterium]|nr:dihydroneopterin aldolase [Actinomycetota bacterium]